MKLWPALDLAPTSDPDLFLVLVDDFAPTAVEERPGGTRVFFSNATQRDGARSALDAHGIPGVDVDVSDEDWATRSQRSLPPVTVGRITILPAPYALLPTPYVGPNPQSLIPSPFAITIVIQPSMGFGTGHHATTRLCLAAMQRIDLTDRTVLDVGTGSGVVAIAAARLGASRALGIDIDPDAIQSARENLDINSNPRNVTLACIDFTQVTLPPADVVVANLTGAMLIRSAARLLQCAAPAASLIVSGILASEEDDVRRAFPPGPTQRVQEDEWICLMMTKS